MMSFQDVCVLPLYDSGEIVAKYVAPRPEDEEKKKEYQKRARADHRNLNLNRAQYKQFSESTNMNIGHREFLQNWVDQLGVCNGRYSPSFENIHFVQGERKGEHVIIAHNRTVRLGEIIHIRELSKDPALYLDHAKKLPTDAVRPNVSTFHFINYGTVVDSANQVLSIGNSGKQGKSNQVGMHGEGLKTAILRFLHCGVGVNIYCCAELEGQENAIAYYWRFYISDHVDALGNLFVKTGLNKPKKWASKNDVVRFHVTLTYHRESFDPFNPGGRKIIDPKPDALGFNMSNYLISAQYIRDRRPGGKDFGTLIKEHPGRVWSWHFHVMDDPDELCFGYDLFLKIGRDRNHVNRQDLKTAIACIWNNIFAEQTDEAVVLQRQYFTLLYPEGENRFIEPRVVKHLSDQAKGVIARLFKEKHPSPAYPICSELKKKWKHRLPGFDFITVSEELWHTLCNGSHKVYESDIRIIEHVETSLLEDAPIQNDLPHRFTILFPNVEFRAGHNSQLTHVMVGKNKLLVNWCAISRDNKSEEVILNDLVCKLLPSALGDAFNVAPLLIQPSPPPLIVPKEKEECQNPTGFDDEEEDIQIPLESEEPIKKRERPPPLLEELLGEPPQGYKWIKTFSVIPK